jgi:hypothetical protein
MKYANQQTVVYRQRIGKHAYNNKRTVESGVSYWVRPEAITRTPEHLSG